MRGSRGAQALCPVRSAGAVSEDREVTSPRTPHFCRAERCPRIPPCWAAVSPLTGQPWEAGLHLPPLQQGSPLHATYIPFLAKRHQTRATVMVNHEGMSLATSV